MRFTCLSIKEILCGLNINDPDCRNKVCMMNRILRYLYTRLANTKLSRIAVARTGGGEKTVQFPHGVKQVHKFLIAGDSKCIGSGKCTIKVEGCRDCHCDGLYELKMEEVWKAPREGQYYFTQEEGKRVVKMNVPQGVTQGWIVYSRGAEELEDLDSEICIDDNALPILEMIILKTYAEKNREVNMAAYYKNELNEMLKQELDNQEKLPYRIWGAQQGQLLKNN